MADVLVGIFDRYEDAERVRTELVSKGFDPGHIAMSETGWQVSPSGTAQPVVDPAAPADIAVATSDTGTTTTRGTTTATMTSGGWTGSGPTATGGTGTIGDTTTADDSMGHRIANFFRRIFGADEVPGEAHPYYEAVRRGSIAVTVELEDDAQRATAEDVMSRCGAVDIDARTESWRTHGWQGWDPDAPALNEDELRLERERHVLSPGEAAGATATGSALADEEIGTQRELEGDRGVTADVPGGTRAVPTGSTGERTTVPVVEETMQVGKREVSRGGMRVFTRVEQVPVEDSVTLREERAVVERHAVDRPATEADLAAAQDATIEVRATGEEAVVAKTARVVEEVTVGKQATERAQKISDTVRRTKVDVQEEAPAASRTTTPGARTGETGTDAGEGADRTLTPRTPPKPDRR